MKIMVIDVEHDITSIFKVVLEGTGFQVLGMHLPTSVGQPTDLESRFGYHTRFVERGSGIATVESCIEGSLEKVYEPAMTLIDWVAGHSSRSS